MAHLGAFGPHFVPCLLLQWRARHRWNPNPRLPLSPPRAVPGGEPVRAFSVARQPVRCGNAAVDLAAAGWMAEGGPLSNHIRTRKTARPSAHDCLYATV